MSNLQTKKKKKTRFLFIVNYHHNHSHQDFFRQNGRTTIMTEAILNKGRE